MNASGDLGDFSEFTISSDCDNTENPDSSNTDNELTHLDTPVNKSNTENAKLLRIELSRKTMELEKYRKVFYQKEEELQDRIDALIKQREIIQHQLEQEICTNKEKSFQLQQKLQKKIENLENRQHFLEQTNSKLVESTVEVKSMLDGDLRINEEMYENLNLKPDYELSVREVVQKKIHEIVRPITQEIRSLKLAQIDLNCDKNESKIELDATKQALKEERDNVKDFEDRLKDVILELSKTKDQVKVGNYKIENFDRLLKDHDKMVEDQKTLKVEFDRLKVNYESLHLERDQLYKNGLDYSQTQRLLELDKEYLTKQVNELTMRCNNAEDRLHTAWKQLEDATVARDQFYEKYVGSREDFRRQYENRLKEELDSLRLKTENEIEKIKINTREMYEREVKSANNQSEVAVRDREIAESQLKECTEKLEKVKMEYSIEKSSLENRVSELMNEVKMRAFEADRTNILYDEACNKLNAANLDCEKYQTKFELLTKEYYKLESNNSSRIHELEVDLKDAKSKMESYENLEKELDLAVMHAAQTVDADDTGDNQMGGLRLKPSLISWINDDQCPKSSVLPSSAGRRMQQSIELARRVLHLERMLRERTAENQKLQTQLEETKDNLEKTEQILGEAKQPYEYLIESLRKKEVELRKMKEIQKETTANLNKTRKEKVRLSEEKNKLLADLELLLSQKDELMNIRKLVEQSQQQQQQQQPQYYQQHPMKKLSEMQDNSKMALKGNPDYDGSGIRKIPILSEYGVSRS